MPGSDSTSAPVPAVPNDDETDAQWRERSVAEQLQAAAVPGDQAVEVVGDLTDEHRGWIVKVAVFDHLIPHRTFALSRHRRGCVRRWVCDGVAMVGLLDDHRASGVIGTEHIFPASTPCELVREVRSSRRV